MTDALNQISTIILGISKLTSAVPLIFNPFFEIKTAVDLRLLERRAKPFMSGWVPSFILIWVGSYWVTYAMGRVGRTVVCVSRRTARTSGARWRTSGRLKCSVRRLVWCDWPCYVTRPWPSSLTTRTSTRCSPSTSSRSPAKVSASASSDVNTTMASTSRTSWVQRCPVLLNSQSAASFLCSGHPICSDISAVSNSVVVRLGQDSPDSGDRYILYRV